MTKHSYIKLPASKLPQASDETKSNSFSRTWFSINIHLTNTESSKAVHLSDDQPSSNISNHNLMNLAILERRIAENIGI